MKTKLITTLVFGFIISCVTAQSPTKQDTINNIKSPPQSAEEPQTRVPGVLGFESNELSNAITVPKTIEANKSFQATVTTSGNGCANAGDTGVILSDNSADVFVYDFTTAIRPGVVCTMILKQFSHTATLSFSKRGEAVIRVWGRRQGGASPLGEPVIVEKRLMVK